ncbi:MAG: hypothetical protein QOJ05_129 [Verrucomicrobiota bacterium]|jgi:hypothetical protein
MKTSSLLSPALRAFISGSVLLAASMSVLAADLIVTPARPGAVDGTKQNSDEFIWRLFVQFVTPVAKGQPSPVVFETWASDKDTFSLTPHWPEPNEPKKFQSSVLRSAHTKNAGPIDIPCSPPGNAAVGGFPTTGSPAPCIAEEVRRNRPLYDYIFKHKLNTQEGLAAAYKAQFKVDMPKEAIAVKGDWVPVQTLLQWIPKIGNLDNLHKLYFTGTSDNVEYALLSLHVSSRQNTNWVWGSFEHQLTPGRCDDIGCWDTFGAVKAGNPPNHKMINTQYGSCQKSPALKALMTAAGVSPVWENYCLKSSMVDYTAPDGTPYALGNSVIERIVGNGTVAASSCIACHVYASFGANGQTTPAAIAMLPYNPTGKPIPAVLDGSLKFDFMWGVLLAPTPTPTPSP